jgi:hypothetical protein
MSGTTPVLSYIGSVDTSSDSAGTIMFSVNFNAAIAVLMFEYKYQPVSVTNPTPENLTYSGFVYPESAQPAQGSNNTYYVPVPAIGASSEDYNVSIRVYDANNLGVTNWSNDLQAYAPPQQPLILTDGALFDRGAYPGTSTIWINLNSATLTAGNQYIVSYYYVPDGSSSTHWVVTELLTASNTGVLTVIMDGVVSTDPDYSYVYVAVNAVREFSYLGTTYYSVSEISNTETATQAEITAPVLTSIVYQVYSNRSQVMDITWTPPTSDFIPGFGVNYYEVYAIINDPYSTPVLVATVNAPTVTLAYDVSGYAETDSLTFYVVATLTSGTVTPDSNTLTENIFYYATAPATLFYNWAVYEEEIPNTVDVSFTFTDSTDTGSGDVVGYVWQIQQNNSGSLSVVATGNIAYDGPGQQYNQIASFIYNASYLYKVIVFLQTNNTNSSPASPLDGASADSSTIVPSAVPFIYNVVDGTNTLSFNVSSNVELAPTAAIFYIAVGGSSAGQMSSITYNTISGSPVNVDGNYVYTFSFTAAFDFATGKYTITASNQAGIGFYIVNHA